MLVSWRTDKTTGKQLSHTCPTISTASSEPLGLRQAVYPSSVSGIPQWIQCLERTLIGYNVVSSIVASESLIVEEMRRLIIQVSLRESKEEFP